VALNLATQTEFPGETGPHGTKVSPLPPLQPEDLAKLFPNLEILECLGRGGMGAVYKARQLRLNRLVALKIIAPEKEKDPHFAERFQREGQALAHLNHQNIVTVHDFGETGGLFYLLMEYVDGLNLRQLLQSRKIAPEEALAIVPPICDALQYAHQQGIVHRDIKPENILLDKQGRVKIADFGIARMLATDANIEPLTGAQQIVGTPHYMAPEQIEKPTKVDHRADIYSLGVVFYEMLTGELPIGRFAPPSQKVQVDVRLDEVVLRTLEKEPERRYQQAGEVKTHVETIAKTPGPEPAFKAGSISHQAAAKGRLSRAAIIGAVWAPLFLIVLLLFFWRVRVEVPPNSRPLGPTGWQIALRLTLLPLGVGAPFGTTILGLIAISQIRNSRGKLYGMGLAVADALFYPMLLLDAFIFYAFLRVFEFRPHPWEFQQHPGFAFVWLAALFVILAMDYWIVRSVWRAAIPESAATLPSFKKSVPAALVSFLLILVALPCLIGFVLWMSYEGLQRPTPTSVEQTPIANGRSSSGSAVVEKTNTTVIASNSASSTPDYVKALRAFQDILQQPDNSWEEAFKSGDLPSAAKGLSELINRIQNYNRLVQGAPVSLAFLDVQPVMSEALQALIAGDRKRVEDILNSTNNIPADTTTWETLQRLAMEQRLARQTNPAALAAFANSGLSFGPVIERTVNDLDKDVEDPAFLDLDTGEFCGNHIFPIGVKSALTGRRAVPWLRPVIAGFGVDAEGYAKEHALLVFDMIALPTDSWLFDALTPNGLVTNAELNLESRRTTQKLVAKKTPATWLIHTREGGVGILQISGFKEAPKAVRIRYKLVQQTTAS